MGGIHQKEIIFTAVAATSFERINFFVQIGGASPRTKADRLKEGR